VNETWGEGLRALLIHGGRIALIVALSVFAYRSVGFAVHRMRARVQDEDPTTSSDRELRAETLGRIVRQAALVALVLVAGMMIFRELGYSIGPIVAGAGFAGLALGFGAQELVEDVISGFFLLLENQIRVGDVVEVAGDSGVVESVNLRTTVLRDGEGAVHTIPNGSITKVTNRTRDWSRMILDVGVGYGEDIDRVIDVLTTVGRELYEEEAWRSSLLAPLEVAGVQELADSAVILRILFKTRPKSQWGVAREMRKRIKKAFDKQGIEIPFPHTTLCLDPGDQGVLRHFAIAGPEDSNR